MATPETTNTGTSRMDGKSRRAEKTKLTARYISILETKGRNVTLARVETIAAALGVDPCDLLCPDRRPVTKKEAVDMAIDALRRHRDSI